jgi:tetratricopeptide (TPR) repeat protein
MRGREFACRLGARTVIAVLLGFAPNASADAVARFADAPTTPAPSANTPSANTPSGASLQASPSAPVATPPPDVPLPTRRPPPRSGAAQLSDRATAYVAAGRLTEAIGLYTESIRLDPNNGVALIELGKLRARLGESGEAEQLFSTAVRMPSVAAPALVERAHLRRREGRDAEATADLERAFDLGADDAAHAEELSAWYVARRAWLPALAVWRRTLGTADGEAAARRAALQVRALGVLAASLDVVRAGAAPDRSWTRHALARIASTSTP